MTQEPISNLRVTSRTAQFVSTLELLEKTQGQFLEALRTLYGDEAGDEIFNNNTGVFDAVQERISRFLTFSIVSSLGDGQLKETI